MNAYLKKCVNLLPDKAAICLKYYYHFRRFPNLKDPKTYNEKIQWLKLYDHNPIYVQMVDKYEAKKYVEKTLGGHYVVPTYGVWNTFDEIDFCKLPQMFVLKTTHDCGGVFIVKNKDDLNIENCRKFINQHLKCNYFYEGREWPYKKVVPRIIAEKYILDEATENLKDYKFFAYDGVVRALFVASDRQSDESETKFDFFDREFNHLEIINGHPNSSKGIEKPSNFGLMINLAERLSNGFPHIRVDFYESEGKLFVGELTLYHYSGMVPFVPEEWDYKFGEWLKLPSIIK